MPNPAFIPTAFPGSHVGHHALFGALVLTCAGLAQSPISAAAPVDAAAETTLDVSAPVNAFEQIWQITREQIYPPSLVETHLDPATHARLHGEVAQLESIGEIPGVLNPFLDSLGVSHTQLYSHREFEYAFFRSLFGTRDPDLPPFSHSGLQLLQSDKGWFVREVIDGLPADKAGLRRGDALLTVDGEPFGPTKLCDGGEQEDGKPQAIVLRRGESVLSVPLPCVRQNPHASMLEAIGNSLRRFAMGDRVIGYLRLWTGTGPDSLKRYRAALAQLNDTDALILDLRGGFGGAWYEHLDPFFPDRMGFFTFTVINREGSTSYDPEPRETPTPYDRPMAVLINEGTRSGKEAVAFQFRKSRRAELIGTTTKGAFSAGKGLFVESEGPLVYYLAVAEYRLDGQKIEGVGVAPDRIVPYPIAATGDGSREAPTDHGKRDPQLAAALEYLNRLLKSDAFARTRAENAGEKKRADRVGPCCAPLSTQYCTVKPAKMY
jgi:carboxyl-terminal processing protease